jgi:hypothetical protein
MQVATAQGYVWDAAAAATALQTAVRDKDARWNTRVVYPGHDFNRNCASVFFALFLMNFSVILLLSHWELLSTVIVFFDPSASALPQVLHGADAIVVPTPWRGQPAKDENDGAPSPELEASALEGLAAIAASAEVNARLMQ